ncbi:ABC transporter ATP-binding protein [uncultured Microscilla sp.]|uniref:ABC transporter ATP-binding protein n=1 Tax=uncultured Microscilla sp. TaxID=432653 RepID=UPI002629C00A|nr:ABC transporter ATP-binding protein [uncultured Microscilla sp.]
MSSFSNEEENEVILDVRNLEVSFSTDNGIIKAVDNISFQIPRGKTLGIVGESGSGKSVTSLAIMRLIQEPVGKITSGEIWFDSPTLKRKINLAKATPQEMREIRGKDIAMVFQEPMTSLNPVYTCGNQVMEAILLHENVTKKEAYDKTIELFKKVRLPRPKKMFNSYPHEISGGQKQRVMISMALSCNPRLLIADEPTTALDVTVQAAILDLLQILHEDKDVSIIFITHDLGVIAEIADDVMVMYHGRMMEKDDVWNIFDNPQHPYTKGLLACRPRLDVQMRVLPVIDDFMEVTEDDSIIEKANHKYASVGEALLLNFVTEDEVEERNRELAQKPPILEVKKLKKYFPIRKGLFQKRPAPIKAVDDVSFQVYPGETIGLVGESGSGKTTLGRTIMRLIEPTGGSIIFENERINDFKGKNMRKLRRDMQIIFQDPYSSLNPRITIGDAILEPMRLHGILANNRQRKDRVIELLETVSLKPEHYNRYPHEFSGGQRQRVVIARTLSLNPKFIICDESVSALDVSVQAQVLNLLNELKDKFNLTYIFISHDLSVVKFMSDRLIVMNQGKIVESDYADNIYDNPKEEYTKKLIEAIPKGTLEDIRKAQLRRRLGKEKKNNNSAT